MANPASILTTSSDDFSLYRLSRQNHERIIYLLFTEGLNTEAIARRFNVTGQTIRRIRAIHMAKSIQSKADDGNDGKIST